MPLERLVMNSARTSCAYDNLRHVMRNMFYRLTLAGTQPTGIRAGLDTLIGYEMLSEQNDPPVTTFKGVAVELDGTLPPDQMRFVCGNDVIGEIHHVS